MLTKTEVTAKTTAEEDAAIKLWETKIDAALAKALIGPTGRLRAPTARVGRRLLVGFDEATYRATLG